VIAALLDSAMTHCLFAHRLAALTGQLCVRFHQPLRTDQPALVRAWVVRSHRRLHRLRAELRQRRRVTATAEATFLPLRRRRADTTMRRVQQ
jgi:acyl-coenzyme A thioesterase PaaI-like protein